MDFDKWLLATCFSNLDYPPGFDNVLALPRYSLQSLWAPPLNDVTDCDQFVSSHRLPGDLTLMQLDTVAEHLVRQRDKRGTYQGVAAVLMSPVTLHAFAHRFSTVSASVVLCAASRMECASALRCAALDPHHPLPVAFLLSKLLLAGGSMRPESMTSQLPEAGTVPLARGSPPSGNGARSVASAAYSGSSTLRGRAAGANSTVGRNTTVPSAPRRSSQPLTAAAITHMRAVPMHVLVACLCGCSVDDSLGALAASAIVRSLVATSMVRTMSFATCSAVCMGVGARCGGARHVCGIVHSLPAAWCVACAPMLTDTTDVAPTPVWLGDSFPCHMQTLCWSAYSRTLPMWQVFGPLKAKLR